MAEDTQASLSPDEIKAAVTEALQQTETKPEFDPETYWAIPENLEDGEQSKALNERIEKFVDAKISPIRQQLNEAYAVINVMNQRKADNPDIVEAHDEAIKLMQSGVINDYSTAIEFVKLKNPTKAKPTPPPSASSPSVAKSEPTQAPRDKRRGMPSVYEIIQGNPEIQEAIKQGRM